jgi:beta-alanine--pyruvate transaminase
MSKAPSLDNFWMPFTPNREFKSEPRMFERAEGVHYFTPDGRKILDGSSGLFCTPLGHCRREIADAVHEQLLTLDYTPTFTRRPSRSRRAWPSSRRAASTACSSRTRAARPSTLR